MKLYPNLKNMWWISRKIKAFILGYLPSLKVVRCFIDSGCTDLCCGLIWMKWLPWMSGWWWSDGDEKGLMKQFVLRPGRWPYLHIYLLLAEKWSCCVQSVVSMHVSSNATKSRMKHIKVIWVLKQEQWKREEFIAELHLTKGSNFQVIPHVCVPNWLDHLGLRY